MSARTPLALCRNIGIVAHVDAGKTTLSERILYYTGALTRMGEVDDGAATMDWMPQEQERGITITAAATTCFWSGMLQQHPPHRINLIDTPGHVDFTAEVERSLPVLDGLIVVACGVSGIEPQTESVWRQADRHRIPRLLFVNKLDRVGADFARVIESAQQRFGAAVIALQFPVVTATGFRGVVDLIEMRVIHWDVEPLGRECVVATIPPECLQAAQNSRDRLVAAAAEACDELTSVYVDTGDLAPAQIRHGLRMRTIANEVVLALCGAALRNKGVQPLLDAVIDYLPAPAAPCGQQRAHQQADSTRSGVEGGDDLAALVFKIATNAIGESLAYVRVSSGTLLPDSVVPNVRTGVCVTVGELVQMHANVQVPVTAAHAGDIVAIRGLEGVVTGDLLGQASAAAGRTLPSFPEPVIAVALEARNPDDESRLTAALEVLVRDDPSLRIVVDVDSGSRVLAGMGELHLDVVVERLRREFGLDVGVGAPRVAYRQTITRTVEREGVHNRRCETDSAPARVRLRLEPVTPVEAFDVAGVRFDPQVSALSVASRAAIHDAIGARMRHGLIGGHPLHAVQVIVLAVMPADCEDVVAMTLAADAAMRAALEDTAPRVLEPVMNVTVTTPESRVGDVVGELRRRRAVITAIDEAIGATVVSADAPMAAMFGVATTLRSLTQGRASIVMRPSRQAFMPVSDAASGDRRFPAGRN